MRRRICAGNWKMYKTCAETAQYIERFLQLLSTIPSGVEVILCPPFTALARAADLSNDRIALGAQNLHWEAAGAFTGEVSAPMLLALGMRYVIVGHSERRRYFHESDDDVRRKVAAALAAGLRPILAVGEPLAVREAGNAQEYAIAQVRAALNGVDSAIFDDLVVAYEPIWAIGTGRNCDPGDANEMMGAIRSCMPALADVPILYGGSVKPQNIASYAAQPEIDGALVGGASLDPDDFAQLAAAL